MLKSAFLSLLFTAFMAGMPCFCIQVSVSNEDAIKQAKDLVHQAWNPGGEPPKVELRIDLLQHALQLLKDSPARYTKGHRGKAMRDIKLAINMLTAGDPDKKATDLIRDADSELRETESVVQ